MPTSNACGVEVSACSRTNDAACPPCSAGTTIHDGALPLPPPLVVTVSSTTLSGPPGSSLSSEATPANLVGNSFTCSSILSHRGCDVDQLPVVQFSFISSNHGSLVSCAVPNALAVSSRDAAGHVVHSSAAGGTAAVPALVCASGELPLHSEHHACEKLHDAAACVQAGSTLATSAPFSSG